jgi:hypothetical protein
MAVRSLTPGSTKSNLAKLLQALNTIITKAELHGHFLLGQVYFTMAAVGGV